MSEKFRLIGVWLLAILLAAMTPALVVAHGGGGGGGGGHGGGGGGHGGGGWGGGYGGGYGGHAAIGAYSGAYHGAVSGFSHGPVGYGAYAHAYHGYGWNHGGQWWQNGYGRNWNYFRNAWAYNWYPWFGFDWWPNFYAYYPYYYNYGNPDLCYGDVVSEYQPLSYTAGYVAGGEPIATPDAAVNDQAGGVAPGEAATPDALGEQFLTEARDAFLKGNYQDALRLGGHAAVEMPRNSIVHSLLMQAMLALGDYRGATMEAHAASSVGQPISWDTLYGFYGNIQTYTEQLRALEKYAAGHKSDPGALFLLGYQYVIMGHKDVAKDELVKSLLLAPKDRLAANLLVQIGGTIPETVAAVQRQMDKTAKGGATLQAAPVPPAPGK